MKKNARDLILARRALFVSTAVAALSCSPKEPVNDQTSTSTTTSTSKPTSKPTADRPEAKPPRPWSKAIAEAPPFDIPKGVSKGEQSHLERIAAEMKAYHALIKTVWEMTPGCDPTARDCKDWKKLEKAAKKMYLAIDDFSPGACPGVSSRTASVNERKRSHWKFVRARVEEIEKHLAKLALDYGTNASDKWSKQLAAAKEPPPRPCLSPCRMPELADVTISVPFAENSADLDAANEAALQNLLNAQQRNGNKAVLMVRGHAASTESDPAGLATKRAKAVVDWLVGQGIPAADLKATSFGADYRVGKDAERRVDFEVVPR